MYEEILVPTDEHDLAELPVRHRTPRRARFLGHLRAIVRDLLVPTARSGGTVGDLDHEVQVPTDNASSHAIALAARHDARLHFLYVISSRKYDTSIQSAVVPLEEEGEAILEHLVEASERAGVETVRAVEVGPPIRTIAEYVGEQDIDLVVVNERGHRGVVSRILGSLSERLAAQVDVEIRTVPSGDGL